MGAYSLVVVLELVEWIAVTSTVDLSMEPFVQLSAQELSSEDMKHFWANVSLARRSAIKMVVTCRDTVLHKPLAILYCPAKSRTLIFWESFMDPMNVSHFWNLQRKPPMFRHLSVSIPTLHTRCPIRYAKYFHFLCALVPNMVDFNTNYADTTVSFTAARPSLESNSWPPGCVSTATMV